MISKCKILLYVFLVISFMACDFASKSSQEQEMAHVHAEKTIYTCPMHPEIRQENPGHCPICGMNLVKVENSHDNHERELEVKKDASINISPYQADLVGIKPLQVIKKNVDYSLPVSGRVLSRGALAFQIFIGDLRYVHKGSRFVGSMETYPEETLRGEITSIDTMADPTSHTIRIDGRVKGGEKTHLVESVFVGHIESPLGSQIVIPEKSILFSGEGSFVYLYEGKMLQPQKVILGPKVGDEYVVTKGLKVGDLVSSGPNFLIDSEAKIRGLNVHQSHH